MAGSETTNRPSPAARLCPAKPAGLPSALLTKARCSKKHEVGAQLLAWPGSRQTGPIASGLSVLSLRVEGPALRDYALCVRRAWCLVPVKIPCSAACFIAGNPPNRVHTRANARAFVNDVQPYRLFFSIESTTDTFWDDRQSARARFSDALPVPWAFRVPRTNWVPQVA